MCVLAFPSPPNQVDRRVTGPRSLRVPCTAPAAVKSSKMPNKMLIDATHPEETRVVVVRGNRVEEFDFETAQRKQLRGCDRCTRRGKHPRRRSGAHVR